MFVRLILQTPIKRSLAMRINVSWRVFFFFQLAVFPVSRCFFDVDEFEQRTMALSRVVNYLVQRPHQMNVDGLYGITLAEAHLSATLSHPNAKFLAPHYRNLLASISKFLHRARVYMRNNVRPESQEVSIINAILNEPSLWIRPIFWQQGALGSKPTPGLNRSMAEKSIFQGSPQEKESDLCIGQLIIRAGPTGERCKVSEDCTEMLLREDDTAGYPLTHRLLYVQIARALKCWDNNNVNPAKLIPAYCREILQNLVNMEATEFPGVSRDLAIEQVLLCGMEGFVDFANNHYANLIRSWAHPLGCYNSKGFVQTTNSTLSFEDGAASGRRSSEKMDFGCENHASGLAAGTLTLFVRESVENMNSSRSS